MPARTPKSAGEAAGASASAAAAAASSPAANDTVVLITGCSEGGIGHALARELSSRPGVQVIATARRLDAMKSLLEEEHGGSKQRKIHLLPLDVSDPASVAACRTSVDALTSGRGVDVLVNNAGATVQGALLDVPVDAAQRVFDVNVFGSLRVTQAFAPAMIARGVGGLVVNVGSAAGYASLPLKAVYSATKHSVRVLSDALRIELMPFGVRVMLVAPGYVRTAIDVRSREQGRWFAPAYGASAYALYRKAHALLTSSIFDQGGLGGGKSLTVDVFARMLSDRLLAELEGARRAAGEGVVGGGGGGGGAGGDGATTAKRSGRQPAGVAIKRRWLGGGGAAAAEDKNDDDNEALRAPLELAGLPTSAAARARLATPPSLLDLLLSPRCWLPSVLGGPTRHLRLGPCSTSAWLSGSLLPLWLSDLIFGLKMGLWEVKAAAAAGEAEGGGKGEGKKAGGKPSAAVVSLSARKAQ
jgi:1-acylglycerone phosphate reductase